jgi:putative transposase
VQTCIVHLIRTSSRYCGYKERNIVAREREDIYRAVSDTEPRAAPDAFETCEGDRSAGIVKLWRDNWERVIRFLHSARRPPLLYTTNTIESLNYPAP